MVHIKFLPYSYPILHLKLSDLCQFQNLQKASYIPILKIKLRINQGELQEIG